jgi:hypothetical protein
LEKWSFEEKMRGQKHRSEARSSPTPPTSGCEMQFCFIVKCRFREEKIFSMKAGERPE